LKEKINHFEYEKHRAVDEEDFDQAKYFKQVIDKMKVLGNQMLILQAEKQVAIESEDYDLAKELKI